MSTQWRYLLPTTVEVCGIEYEIRSDFRAILDICAALSDPELSEQDKMIATADIFYPNFEHMPPEHYEEAVKRCFWFINCGEPSDEKKSPKVIDWEQDEKMIVADINKVAGCEIRQLPYCHWWTFLAWFNAIGEGQLSTVVAIREKRRKGKALTDWEKEFYRNNRSKVDFKTQYTDRDDAVLSAWTGKRKAAPD